MLNNHTRQQNNKNNAYFLITCNAFDDGYVNVWTFMNVNTSHNNRPNKLVWHGAQNKHGLRDPTNNCDSWHSDGLNKFGTATPIHNPRNHLAQQQRHNSHQDRAKSRKAKRFLAGQQEPSTIGQNSRQYNNITNTTLTSYPILSSTMFIESVDKFPCRMPLIVLCIETQPRPIDNTYIRNELATNMISS